MSDEENRFSARAARYMRVGTNVGAVGLRVAGQRMLGLGHDRDKAAADLAAALAARDRGALGLNAPPDGLFFTGADYPDD